MSRPVPPLPTPSPVASITGSVAGSISSRIADSLSGSTVFWIAVSLAVWTATAAPPASSAGLAFVESFLDEAGGVDGIDGASDLAVSPDGRHLYVAGKTDDAIAVFSRNPGDGTLAFVEVVRQGVGGVSGLDRPVDLAIAPDGAQVYAAGDAESAVVAFARNEEDGRLDFLAAYAPGAVQDRVFDVAVTPDGAHLYAASFDTDAIVLYQRDAASGALTFDGEVARNGVGGVTGLDGVRSLATSPDGAHLYAASILGSGWLAAFARDPATGGLTFVGSLADGVDGVDGLGGAREVAVSPDGGDVYATGGADDAVAHLARDPESGALSFVSAIRLPVPSPLDEANGLVVSPDGLRVYVTGRSADAVVAFDRNPQGGALTPAEVRRDQVDGVTGLHAAVAAALDPSGVHLYVASETGDSVAVFVPEPGWGALATGAIACLAAQAARRRR